MKNTCKKILSFGLTILLLGISLLSCQQEGDVTNIISPVTSVALDTATEQNKNFETRAVPFVYGSDDNVEGTFYLRIYDENEYVPYIGLRYCLEEFCSLKIKDVTYSDGEYTITAILDEKTFPIVVNIKNNTMYCPAWRGYTRPNPSISFGNGTLIKSIKSFSGQKSITFDLAKYGFKIYGGIDDAYVPFCIVNQLFVSTILNLQLLYNGKKIYLYSSSFQYPSFRDSPWYSDLNNRPKELIDVTYRMLCFTHDYIYGKPGYYGFADGGKGRANVEKVRAADALSFDEMLSRYDPDTKDLLKATSYKDYLKGLARLVFYTYGDEHASIHLSNDILMYDSDIKATVADVSANGRSAKWNYDKKITSSTNPGCLNYCRKQKGIIDDFGLLKSDKVIELIDGGKTLIIRFDAFELDESGGWNNYYGSNPSAEPNPAVVTNIPNDTIGLFYKAFYYIKNKSTVDGKDYSNVKNILIDDSGNGGGAVPVLNWLLTLISGYGDFAHEDIHTNTQYYEYIKADLNLDGLVNGDDDEFREFVDNLNIAILTSFTSFSCGNALPYGARERGISIIGEQSGGGSCVVGSGVTADGIPFNFSMNERMCSSDFSETVENGAKVDVDLTDGTGTDYSKFYDNDELISTLKSLFGDKY